MAHQAPARRGRVYSLAAVLTLSAFALYAATASRSYTGDGFEFASAVEASAWFWLVDPFHLALGPLAWGWYRLWQALGWAGRAMLPLQWLNALGGALCVGLMYRLVRRLGCPSGVALGVAAGFAFSFGIWRLSTQAEFVTLPLAAALWVLGMALDRPTPAALSYRRATGLGLATAVATLTYASNAILVPVVVAGYLLAKGIPLAVRLRRVAMYLCVVAGVVVPAYLIARGLAGDGTSLTNFLAPFGGGGVYGQVTWKNFPHGVYAFLRSLGGFANVLNTKNTLPYLAQASWLERAGFGAYYALLLAVAVIPLALAWRRRAVLLATHGREMALLALWSVLYAAFGFYWVPGDPSFWVPLLAAWWIVAAMVASAQAAEPGEPESQPGGMRCRPELLLAAGVMLLFAANAAVLLPDCFAARNPWYGAAQDVRRLTTPADAVLVLGDGRLYYYVDYFAQRKTLLISASLADRLRKGERSAQLDNFIASVRSGGGRVLLVGLPPDAPTGPGGIAQWPGATLREVAGGVIFELLP